MSLEHKTADKKPLIIVGFLLLNILVMSTNIVLKDNKTLLEYSIGVIFSPFQIVYREVSDFFSDSWEKYFFKKNIYKKYREAKSEVSRLRNENYILKRSNESLRREVDIEKIKSRYQIVTNAQCVAMDKNFKYNHIVINAGSSKGIKQNMFVVNQKMELVGKVIGPVTPFTSKVRLLTSKTGGIGAYIANQEMEGFLTGNNEAVCNFKYLIENKPVHIGDQVVTSGTDGIFPEKIPIGIVIGIKKEYLIQQIEVSPYYLKSSIKNLIVCERNIE